MKSNDTQGHPCAVCVEERGLPPLTGWDNQRRRPIASETFRAAELANVGGAGAFRRFHAGPGPSQGTAEEVDAEQEAFEAQPTAASAERVRGRGAERRPIRGGAQSRPFANRTRGWFAPAPHSAASA